MIWAVLLCAAAGCKVTGDDIEYWKGTVKGPGKIVAVMLSDNYPMELRTQAALALVEMERTDVNGVQKLQQAMQRLDEDTRQEIIHQMVEGLEGLMRGDETAPQEDDPLAGPPPQQVRAKDAAFLLIVHASPADQARLTDAVVGWYVVDFNGRNLAGNYSAEQVIRSLGARAAAKLVEALNARMPQQAMIKIAELIAQLGDAETKARAGARLVEIYQEMLGNDYLEWLKSKIRESLAQQQREIPAERVNEIASINRENFINDGLMPAMKHLATVDAVAERLLAIAEDTSVNETRRGRALLALEGNARQEHIERYIRLAVQDTTPIPVRDEAFERIGDLRSQDAIDDLWPMVTVAENDELKKRLRWRAAEMVLHIGGPAVIPQLLSRLPTGEEVQYEPEELEGYATVIGRMTPPPTEAMTGLLRSSHWWQRVLGLRYFERKGTEADVARMQPLTSDEAPCLGEAWNEINTVGKVAQAAITGLQERLRTPAQGTAPGTQPEGQQQQ